MEITKEWLELNAKLQQKKNNLRAELHNRGVLPKKAENGFDRYKYFSEAQYKELFTELFSTFGLELKASTNNYEHFEGTDKQPNGREVTMTFTLYDIETGFYEESVIVGEGLDKGDKAGYKAYTGALKYYFASTFNVATGDDPETESPEGRTRKKASYKQLSDFRQLYTDVEIERICKHYKVETDGDLDGEIVKNYVANRKDQLPKATPLDPNEPRKDFY